MQLVNQQAAQIIKDEKASESLVEEVIKLASDTEKQALLKKNISPLAIRNADRIVAEEILKVI
jgi:UDP-N-acetylglucosamine:LPS N-acetylglucosamine transferase